MLKDIFFSFKENIKQKTTNPFFGTLIIVWFIHNWKLIFTFFNFESNESLNGKILFLSKYFDAKPFLIDIWNCVWITFVVLILTYLLLNLSRLIVNIFDKRLTPWIYKISDSNGIVLKSIFQKLVEERDLLSQKLENEREVKLRLQSETSRLEERIKELITKDIKKESIEQPEIITDAVNAKIRFLLNDIDIKDLNIPFDNIINFINNEEYINVDNYSTEINYFQKAGILKLNGKHSMDDTLRHFIFTDFGEKVKDEFVMKSLTK